MKLSHHTAKGRRAYQEDRLTILERGDLHVLAVYDGHGGDNVSQICEEHFPDIWDEAMVSAKGPPETLRLAVEMLARKTQFLPEGSTLSVAVVEPDGMVWTAVMGDSPIMLRDRKGEWYHTVEHNARTNLQERTAVEGRGGHYANGYVWDNLNHASAGLQMCRALGDAGLSFISREADFESFKDIDLIIVGTDGLLDSSHEIDHSLKVQQLAERAHVKARHLVEYALDDLGSQDNVTAILLRL